MGGYLWAISSDGCSTVLHHLLLNNSLSFAGNTISNSVLIIPAITGLALATKDQVETRFKLCFIGLLSKFALSSS
jgi:hypothetical protein